MPLSSAWTGAEDIPLSSSASHTMNALDSVTPPVVHVVQVAMIHHQPRTATAYCLNDVDQEQLLLSMLAGVDHHQVECEDALSPSVGVQIKVC